MIIYVQDKTLYVCSEELELRPSLQLKGYNEVKTIINDMQVSLYYCLF